MRHWHGFGLVSGLVLSGLLLTPAAHAQEPVEGSGSFTVGETTISVEAGATYFDMDVANGFASAIVINAGDFVRRTDNGSEFSDWGFSSAVEGVAPIELPLISTDIVVFRFDGDWFNDSDNFTNTPGSGPLEFFNVQPIDGTLATVNIATPGETVASRVDIDYGRYSGFLGAGRALPGANGGHHIAFGLYASFSELELGVQHRNTADPTSFATLDEDVDTFSIGPQLVAKSEIDLSPTVGLFGGVSAALLYARGDLDAQQAVNEPFGGFRQFSAQDDQSDFAALFGARGGLNFKPKGTDSIVFSLFGGLEWRNDAYEIVNTQLQPGQRAGTTPLQPVRLEQTGLFTATAGVSLKVKLN